MNSNEAITVPAIKGIVPLLRKKKKRDPLLVGRNEFYHAADSSKSSVTSIGMFDSERIIWFIGSLSPSE